MTHRWLQCGRGPVAAFTCCLLLTACGAREPPAAPGGLAVLAAGSEGFAQAAPGRPLRFPADHGAHPNFRIEWWYLTANLEDAAGRRFGVQWTLFRSAQRPDGEDSTALNPWQDPQVYMAHFAITTETDHHSFQRYARGGAHAGLARAGVSAEPFRAWLDDWSLASARTDASASAAWLPLQLRARQDGFAAALRLDSRRPLVLQGDRGFSRKHPNGGGSYYYSQPFLDAEGALTIDGRTIGVTGQAWLDREWSSQFLQADQSGWDWFALHLDSGEKLMLFRLRAAAGGAADFRHGVLIAPDGTRRQLAPEAIHFEALARDRVAGRDLPVRWRITLEEPQRSLEVAALHPRQWMEVDFGYWEGYVTAHGNSPGESGHGYLEMVGYPPR